MIIENIEIDPIQKKETRKAMKKYKDEHNVVTMNMDLMITGDTE